MVNLQLLSEQELEIEWHYGTANVIAVKMFSFYLVALVVERQNLAAVQELYI